MSPTWHPLASFSGEACTAAAEATILSIVCDDEVVAAGAIRRVCVAPAERGRGLARVLMEAALDWCRGHGADLVLLYAEQPSLYERFGFRPVEQVAFTGPAPPLDEAIQPDIVPLRSDRLRALLSRRRPLSRHVSIVDAPGLLVEHLSSDDSWSAAFSRQLDAAFIYEVEGRTLVLADVIAPVLPRLDRIVAVLAPSVTAVRLLFPPDQLGWSGVPEADDAGLMASGVLPTAFSRPFRIPPTSEF